MPRAFPSAFSYPAESRDSPTLRSEPLLAEQPPREIQHEHALPDIGPVPRAGDKDLRERIPDGQKQREFPLERRFRADVVSRLNSPSRFRNSRSFKVSKPRRQYTHGCVEGRIPVAPCRQRCQGAFAESYKPGSIVRNGLKPIGNRMRCERVYHYEGEYCIITGIGTNGFIVSAYPAGSTRRRRRLTSPACSGCWASSTSASQS